MRLLIAQFSHETNSFSPVVTDLVRFHPGRETLLSGEAAVRRYEGTNTCLGGFIGVARACGAEMVVPVAASAFPSGVVEDEAFEAIAALIVDEVARGGFDGIMLELHGAMITRSHEDGEGELLRRIRAVDPTTPVGITLDMHANLYPAIVDSVDLAAGYRTYPHADMADTARRAGNALLKLIRREARPVCVWGSRPMLPHVMAQGTYRSPNRELQARATEMEARGEAMLASFFVGFPHADVAGAGASAVVVTDGDAAAARRLADELLDRAWAARHDFVFEDEPLSAAVARAGAMSAGQGPIILLDHHDNCASGGTMDTTAVLAEIIRQGLEDVAFFGICDPAAAAQAAAAGIGAEIRLDLGGKLAMPALDMPNPPLAVRGRVARLADGLVATPELSRLGIGGEVGPVAVIDTGRVEIVVLSSQMEPISAGMLTGLGIDPSSKRFVALKSRVHWRAGFGDLAGTVVECAGLGVCTSDYRRIPFRNIRRPIFPLDADGFAPGSV